MASSRSSVVQLDDGQDPQSELQFQDFTLSGENSDVATLSPSGSYSNYKESLDSPPGDENEDLLGETTRSGSSFWKFSYYQSFFDVDTSQVVQRVLWSMVPLGGRATFLDRQIRPKPDLYGPFWIAATLVFSTAISANIANYLASEGTKTWTYDFHKVSLAATAIYSYVFLLPIILWGMMWYRQSSNRYTLLEILCVYGYSLAIYVPISMLWVIQVPWFQWILVIIGASLSGTVLIQTFWPIFREDNKKIAAVVLCLILLFHVLLAVGFVTYFFRPPHEGRILHHSTPASITSSPTIAAITEHSKATMDMSVTEKLDKHIQSLSLVADQQTLNRTNSVQTEKLIGEMSKTKSSKTSGSNINNVVEKLHTAIIPGATLNKL